MPSPVATAAPRKEDRRIQRTRALLREALFSLIVEQGYPSISIQDIADRANVARTTFYLHYTDKDQLLFTSLRDLYNELLSQVPTPSVEDIRRGHFPSISDRTDFDHISQYADFYRIMLGENGSPQFMHQVRQLLADAYEQRWLQPLAEGGLKPRLPLNLIAFLLAGIKISIMLWWVNHNMQPSPDDMRAAAEMFSLNGLLWALGVTEAPSGTSDWARPK